MGKVRVEKKGGNGREFEEEEERDIEEGEMGETHMG